MTETERKGSPGTYGGTGQDRQAALEAIFEEVGAKYGYATAIAEFRRLKDLKITWMRAGDRIDFIVADYLDGAPPGVLRDLADSLYRRVRGEDVPRPAAMLEYLSTPEYLDRYRPIYLERNRISDGSPLDLDGARGRLAAAGLAEYGPDTVLGIAHGIPCFQTIRSQIFRTVALSSGLVALNPPDYVVEYLLLDIPRRMAGGAGVPADAADSARHPRAAEAREWIRLRGGGA